MITRDDVIKYGLLKLPTIKRSVIAVDPHPEMPEFMDSIRGRLEDIKHRNLDPPFRH